MGSGLYRQSLVGVRYRNIHLSYWIKGGAIGVGRVSCSPDRDPDYGAGSPGMSRYEECPDESRVFIEN